MTNNVDDASIDLTPTTQHTYRLSLSLTRRVVRRLIEHELFAQEPPAWKPEERKTVVPDSASFQFSLRVIRRIIRRLCGQ